MARIEPLTGRNAPLLVKALNFMTRRTMGKEVAQIGIMARTISGASRPLSGSILAISHVLLEVCSPLETRQAGQM